MLRFTWGHGVVIRTSLLFAAVLALSACSQSVRKVSSITQEAYSLQPMSEEADLGRLKMKSPEELATLGYIYLENNNLQLARLHFATAIEKQPTFATGYIGLGKVDMFNGQYQAAFNHFAMAGKYQPDSVAAIIGQAQALRFEGKMSAAIEKVNAAMNIAPDEMLVLQELAIIYDLMGNESLSEPLYREVIQRAPDVAANHNNLGMNQMIQQHYPEAIFSFLQALNLHPNSARIKNNLATAYALNGDADKALKIFNTTVGEAAAYNNLGYLYLTQGRYDEAEIFLNKAIAANPQFYQKAQDNLDKIRQLRNTPGK